MLTVVIARPPSTYTTCSFLLYNSILEKLYFPLLHVESSKFLLPLSSWVVVATNVAITIASVATIVISVTIVGVATLEGSLCCYISANQQRRDPKVGFKVLPPFSLSCFLFLSWSYQVKKKQKQKFRWWRLPLLPNSVAMNCNVVATRATTLSQCELQCRHDASCNAASL